MGEVKVARTYNQDHKARPYAKGRRRVSVRAEWFASASRPLELDDVLS